MAEDQAYRLGKVEDGKHAALAEAYLQLPLSERREYLVNRLIAIYRQGHVDHDLLIGIVGELSGLDYIVQQLQNSQLQGEIAAQKEFGNG